MDQPVGGTSTLALPFVITGAVVGTVALVALAVVVVVVLKRVKSRTPEVEEAMNTEQSAEQQYGTKP